MPKHKNDYERDIQKLFSAVNESGSWGGNELPTEGAQLELNFSPASYSYDVRISDLTIHNARGFENLGYFSPDIKHFYQIQALIHPRCVDRWFWYGMMLYQWILKKEIFLSFEQLLSANYRVNYAIRHHDGYYVKVEQYSEFWIENGKIIGNRTKCILQGSYDPDEKYPPAILVQLPVIFIDGRRRLDLEERLLDEVAERHIKQLNFTAHEIRVMSKLKVKTPASKIAKDLNLSKYYIQEINKIILKKAREEYDGFNTATEVALFYSNYRIC